MRSDLLFEVVDENMGDERSMKVAELNKKMGSPWSDSELAKRIDDTPTKDGEGFSSRIRFGTRLIERTC